MLLWEARSVAASEACTARLFAFLDSRYRLVFASESGRAELYRYLGH